MSNMSTLKAVLSFAEGLNLVAEIKTTEAAVPTRNGSFRIEAVCATLTVLFDCDVDCIAFRKMALDEGVLSSDIEWKTGGACRMVAGRNGTAYFYSMHA